MAMKKITMQDIADACGLSRNTVSKVFNGRGAVPEATRQTVLQKARDLGYRLAPEAVPVQIEGRTQTIALLTCNMPKDYHFGTFFLPAFMERLSRFGYTLAMYEISPNELERRVLPVHMVAEQTSGIICIELFDRAYMDMVCSIGLPTIFIDAYAGATLSPMSCDMISMENIAGTRAMTRHLIEKGARRLGFVGDIDHCNSFRERWIGFQTALADAGLTLDRSLCILDGDVYSHEDTSWLLDRIGRIAELPDAFVCANDFHAIQIMAALKRKGLSIPGDVMVTGFDDIPQSFVVDPPLTTARIPAVEIGRAAADILLGRLNDPDRPFTTTYMATTPIYRTSTDK